MIGPMGNGGNALGPLTRDTPIPAFPALSSKRSILMPAACVTARPFLVSYWTAASGLARIGSLVTITMTSYLRMYVWVVPRGISH